MFKQIIKIIILCKVFIGGVYLCEGVSINKEPPVYFYVNHEKELEEIKKHLLDKGYVGVVGPSGIGKTELVRKYIELNENRYDIIAVLNGADNHGPQYTKIIKSINNTLSKNLQISEEPNLAKKNLFNYLNNTKKWLLVYDNLHISENIRVKDIIELRHKGHIIISSQEGSYLKKTINLSYLNSKNSLALVKKILPSVSVEYLEKLVDLMKGYPYTLANGATFLSKNPYMTTEDYITYMNKFDNKIKAHLDLCLASMSSQSKNILFTIAMLNNQEISREVISIFLEPSEELSPFIGELINLGLIEQIEKTPEKHHFRMHDAIKTEVFMAIPDKKTRGNNLLKRLDIFLPLNQTVPVRYNLISKPTMLKNIEMLLDNAQLFQGECNLVLRGNDILLDHYLKVRDWEMCALKTSWLLQNEKNTSLDFMSNKEKVAYGHYLTNVGVYSDFALSNFIEAIKYYKRAQDILRRTKGFYLISNTAHFQLALTQIGLGDLDSAEKNIIQIKAALKKNNIPINQDRVLGVTAKLSLAKGDYLTALREITILEKAESKLYKQIVAAPIYIIKADILNSMGRFKEAYEICKPLYEREAERSSDTNEMQAKILVQLARSELGIKRVKEAKIHIARVVNFFESQKNIGSYSANDLYADALVVRGDISLYSKEVESSVIYYMRARKIYFNKYRANFSKINKVGYNLYMLAMAAHYSQNASLYQRAKKELMQKFGISSFFSQKLLSSEAQTAKK